MNRPRTLLLLAAFMVLPASSQTARVRLTYYHPVRSQCDANPTVTSDGSRIDMNKLKAGRLRWCAVSRDLLPLFPKNRPRRVHIEGHGVYEVRDVTSPRLKKTVDILLHPSSKRVVDGHNVRIRIL